MAEKFHKALELELGGPASPARVARAAKAVDDALRAAAPHLADDAITLVISNRNTKAEIRTWNPAGAAAAELVTRVLQRPQHVVNNVPGGQQIVMAMERPMRVLAEENAVLRKPRAKKVLRKVTTEYVDQLRRLGEPAPPAGIHRVSGSDVLTTLVLRVGRYTAGAPTKARVVLPDQECVDIDVPEALKNVFFEAGRDGSLCSVVVDVIWLRGVDGRLVSDMKTAVARSLTIVTREPAPGAVALFRASAPSAFDDIDDVLENIRGD